MKIGKKITKRTIERLTDRLLDIMDDLTSCSWRDTEHYESYRKAIHLIWDAYRVLVDEVGEDLPGYWSHEMEMENSEIAPIDY